MQARDTEPVRGRGIAPAGRIALGERGRIVRQRERRELQTLVAERGGEPALLGERPARQNLVAERELHVTALLRGTKRLPTSFHATVPMSSAASIPEIG